MPRPHLRPAFILPGAVGALPAASQSPTHPGTTRELPSAVTKANTFRMADARIKANKRFEFFSFPGQRHGYATMSDYWFWLRADCFVRNLLGDDRWNANITELDLGTEQSGGR